MRPDERSAVVHRDADSGFSLIELLTAMVLAGVLMTIGMFALRGYLLSSRESGTATDIRSTLRQAGERSLSEGRTYCVAFTSTSWSLYKADCSVSTNRVGGPW